MSYRRAAPLTLVACLAIAGAVLLAASALDHRMRKRQRPAKPFLPATTNPPRRGGQSAVAFSASAAAASGERADRGTVRPAGRDSMRDPPESWDAIDESADESFPASDPPGKY